METRRLGTKNSRVREIVHYDSPLLSMCVKQGVSNKGKLLTEISKFWFSFLKDVVPNHLITANLEEMPDEIKQYREQLEGRSMLVKSLRVLPVESIVRGYITGKGCLLPGRSRHTSSGNSP